MYYEKLENKSEAEFKRLTGIKRHTFKLMAEILEAQYALEHVQGGKPSKLPINDKLLMTLEYWREYRTYFHIGNSYGYSESQAYKSIKWVEDTLIKSRRFTLPGKKILHTLDKEAIVLVDVTESPIERPKKKAT
jgi:Helix-turn-helix of DDE superfamily endonuclease